MTFMLHAVVLSILLLSPTNTSINPGSMSKCKCDFILSGIRMNQVGDRSVRRPSNLRTWRSRTGIQVVPKFRIRRFYGYVEFTDVFIYDCNLCLSSVRSRFYTTSQILDSSVRSIGRVPILRIPTLVIWGFSKP